MHLSGCTAHIGLDDAHRLLSDEAMEQLTQLATGTRPSAIAAPVAAAEEAEEMTLEEYEKLNRYLGKTR